MKAEKDLYKRYHILLAVFHDAVEILVYPVHIINLAAIYVVFGRRNAENFCQEF